MKIVFTVDDFKGGAGNVIQIIALEFSRRNPNYKIYILLLTGNSKPRYDLGNIEVIYCDRNKTRNKMSPLWFIKKILNCRKLIKEINPDVIISFITRINIIMYISTIKLNIPLIVSERSNPNENNDNIVWKVLQKIAYQNVCKIVVQFEEFLNFDNGKYIKKTVAVPNPILSTKVKKIYSDIDTKDIKIVSIANLRKVKRIDRLINIFSKVYSKYKNISLYIYGEGLEKKDLLNLVEKLNLKKNIFFMGYTNDIYNTLLKSDIFVLSSEKEGFPNAIGEALVIGLPIIAFKCHNGFEDIVLNNENGFLIENGNIEEFSKKLTKLINNPNLIEIFGEKSIELSYKYSIDNVYILWKRLIDNAMIK